MQVEYDGKINMGVTSMNTFQTCRMKWYMMNFLSYRPKRPDKYMMIGTFVHAALEGYYRTFLGIEDVKEASPDVHDTARQNALAALYSCIDAEKAEMNPIPSDILSWEDTAIGIVKNYLYSGYETLFFKKVLAVELPVNEEQSHVNIRGVIDLLVEDYNGNILVVDHKCRGNKMDDVKDLLTVDTQMQVYAYLAEKLVHTSVDYIVHNLLLRKTPELPINKDGRPSKRLTRATPGLMLDWIANTPMEIEEKEHWLEVAEKLKETAPDTFFQRVHVRVYPEVLDATMLNAYSVANQAHEMVEAVHNTDNFFTVTRNSGTYQCKFCPLLAFCASELRNENSAAFIEAHFEQRRRDY